MNIDTETLPAIAGEILAPDQPGWDDARRAWNVAVDQRPALVALPADERDVVALMDYAARSGLKVAPQGSGHNAAAIATLDGTLLVSTRRMRGVEIDPGAQTARVLAGTLWLEVAEAATPHGLFPLSGSSPDVAVVGYTLGGGLSWLGRKHGLAVNHVTAIELVTPGGQLVRATPDDHADVFWALRGGVGNFGVVTAMEFRLFPYGEVYGGMFLWPYERHAEVLTAWAEWTRTAPEEATTSFRIMHFPPLPELPPFLSGRSVVVVDGVVAGGVDDGAAAVAALRALGPELDTWAAASPAAVSRIHMDPEEPVPFLSDSMLVRELDADALAAFAAAVQPGAPVLFGELRHLGGALARVPEGAGAVGALPGEFLLFGVGIVMGPDSVAPVRAALADLKAALAGYESGTFLNFVDRPADAAGLFAGDVYARLRDLRAAIDPDGRMVASHPIPAA